MTWFNLKHLIDYRCIDSKCFCAPAIKSNKPRRKPSSSADEESKTPEPDSELPEEDAKTPREDAQPQSSDEIALESPKDQGI